MRPLVASAVIAVGWSAAVGLVACITVSVAVWFAGETGAFEDAIRAGALSWLVGNGSGLVVEGTSLTAVPVGMLAAWAWLLHRGGRWAGGHCAVRGSADLVLGVATLTLGYAAVGGAVAVLSTFEKVGATPTRSIIATASTALLAGGFGVLRGTGHARRLWLASPEEVRAATRGGLTGIAVMLVAGALLTTGSMLVHVSDIVRLFQEQDAGVLGGAVLILVSAAFVPNAVLSAGAFIAGPGFAVGEGTSVAPGEVSLGALPPFPLFGALPQGDGSAWWLSALLVLPVLAGAVGGIVAVHYYPVFGIDHAAMRGGLAGAVGGVGFGALTALASGSIGPGRMQEIGPDAGATMLVSGLAFLLGGGVCAAATRWVGTARAQRHAEPTDDSG